MPRAVTRPAPSGAWRSRGYGWILDFNAVGYTLHHITSINCVAGERGSHDDFRRAYDRIRRTDAALSLHQAGDLTRYGFERLRQPPNVPHLRAGTLRDPIANFETLWRHFAEHYAFFDLHGVDWQDSHRTHRPHVRSDMSDDALFDRMSEMLGALDDGHVTLSGRVGDSLAGSNAAFIPKDLMNAARAHLAREAQPAGGRRAIPPGESPTRIYQRLRRMDVRTALRAVLGTPHGRISPRVTVEAYAARMPELLLAPYARTRTELKQACNGLLSWCELEPGIGYLAVLRLFGFADTDAARRADDLPRARTELAGFLRDDLAALEAALDPIVDELRHCRSLVLDLRVNGGGFDRAGLAIARRFNARRRTVFTKRAVANGGFTRPQAIVLEATRAPLKMPVVVLTSPLCVSAGEILLLALRALPQVTLIGEPSAGMLSDNLIKPLPNGWELSLSNEIYTAHDGAVFEGRGVEPDVALPVLDAAQLVPALQASLVAAVARCRSGALPARRRA